LSVVPNNDHQKKKEEKEERGRATKFAGDSNYSPIPPRKSNGTPRIVTAENCRREKEGEGEREERIC